MKIYISERAKTEQFCAIFTYLRTITETITFNFSEKNVYIQGMDQSHVCMFELTFCKAWFDGYLFE